MKNSVDPDQMPFKGNAYPGSAGQGLILTTTTFFGIYSYGTFICFRQSWVEHTYKPFKTVQFWMHSEMYRQCINYIENASKMYRLYRKCIQKCIDYIENASKILEIV